VETTVTDSRNDHRQRIGEALARLQAALVRPSFGRHTARSTAVLGDGLQCTSTEQTCEIAFDLSPGLGGERRAPSPTQLMQAAFGACLTMGYQLRAAERGIELSSVRVTVESDSDLRGLLGDPDVSPGFTGLRYHVEITSPADLDAVAELVDAADRQSPVLADLTRPVPVERTVAIAQPAPTGGP
jgi:uncharacterized OsmC-like protein